jgi:POT family proton-dependent oligopeptide transporter
MQLQLDAKAPMSILWQLAPYAVLTLGEVLVSATGLEFAYSQAPAAMKSVLMAFWSVSVTVGNLWVILVNDTVKTEAITSWVTANTGLSVTAFQMFFFAIFAFVSAAGFALASRRYTVREHYRKA